MPRRRGEGIATLIILTALVSGRPARADLIVNTLVNFGGANGLNPYAGLVRDGAGNLYGTTYSGGGGYGLGTVFEVSQVGTANTLTTLVNFGVADGWNPYAGLVRDAAGNLYGTTYYGGTNDLGTVFEVSKVGTANTLTTLASFDGANGSNPHGGLVLDGAGNLYGTTEYAGTSGGGTVFEVSHVATTPTLTTLASFGGASGANGYNPLGGLVFDASGNLYGTNSNGGAKNEGTVFEVSQVGTANTVTTRATFGGTDGWHPEAGLVFDGAGNLYGTTNSGGIYGLGTVFEVSKAGTTPTLATLVNFGGANGLNPRDGLVFDGAGNLYGTTENGGANSEGTVFEVSQVGTANTLTTLASFTSSNGAYPFGGLVLDGSGNLYGTTVGGGTSVGGTVFEVLAPAAVATPEPSTFVTAGTTALILLGVLLRRRARAAA